MSSPEPVSAQKQPLKHRLEKLLMEYGYTAFVVYFVIFAAVLVGFAFAIRLGADVKSTAGTASTWVAAWVATKLTQPLRILATIALTPLVVRVVHFFKGKRSVP